MSEYRGKQNTTRNRIIPKQIHQQHLSFTLIVLLCIQIGAELTQVFLSTGEAREKCIFPVQTKKKCNFHIVPKVITMELSGKSPLAIYVVSSSGQTQPMVMGRVGYHDQVKLWSRSKKPTNALFQKPCQKHLASSG